MIKVYGCAILHLAFRRGRCGWRAHASSVHGASHFLFHEQRRTFRHREIGQRTHRPDYLAQGEEEHEGKILRIDSSNHGIDHFLQDLRPVNFDA